MNEPDYTPPAQDEAAYDRGFTEGERAGKLVALDRHHLLEWMEGSIQSDHPTVLYTIAPPGREADSYSYVQGYTEGWASALNQRWSDIRNREQADEALYEAVDNWMTANGYDLLYAHQRGEVRGHVRNTLTTFLRQFKRPTV